MTVNADQPPALTLDKTTTTATYDAVGDVDQLRLPAHQQRQREPRGAVLGLRRQGDRDVPADALAARPGRDDHLRRDLRGHPGRPRRRLGGQPCDRPGVLRPDAGELQPGPGHGPGRPDPAAHARQDHVDRELRRGRRRDQLRLPAHQQRQREPRGAVLGLRRQGDRDVPADALAARPGRDDHLRRDLRGHPGRPRRRLGGQPCDRPGVLRPDAGELQPGPGHGPGRPDPAAHARQDHVDRELRRGRRRRSATATCSPTAAT